MAISGRRQPTISRQNWPLLTPTTIGIKSRCGDIVFYSLTIGLGPTHCRLTLLFINIIVLIYTNSRWYFFLAFHRSFICCCFALHELHPRCDWSAVHSSCSSCCSTCSFLHFGVVSIERQIWVLQNEWSAHVCISGWLFSQSFLLTELVFVIADIHFNFHFLGFRFNLGVHLAAHWVHEVVGRWMQVRDCLAEAASARGVEESSRWSRTTHRRPMLTQLPLSNCLH